MIECKNLKKAFDKAKDLEYSNGMATKGVVIHREFEKVKVIRKAGSLDHPEIFLIIAEPKEGYKSPNIKTLEKDVKECMGLYGDINVKFKTREKSSNYTSYYAVLSVF